MRLLKRALALEEEVTDGKARNEIEFTYYGKLLDFSELLSAHSKEHQEQWQVKLPMTPDNAGSGSIRIRKTIPDLVNTNLAKYVLTTKLKTGVNGKQIETSIDSSEDMFKAFQIISDGGMIKDRFIWTIPDSKLVWEFDVFYQLDAPVGSGKYHDWIKIDIEVPSKDTPIPPLPVRVVDLIVAQDGERTTESEAIVRSLYDNQFLTKNQIIHGKK